MPGSPPLSTAIPLAPSPPLEVHRLCPPSYSTPSISVSTFMIASKVICDDTYSNKLWSIIGQGMFALQEINQMELGTHSYLEWQPNIGLNELKEFEVKICHNLKGLKSYPTYVLPPPTLHHALHHAGHRTGGCNRTHALLHCMLAAAPSTLPPKPIPPPVPVHASAPPYSTKSSRVAAHPQNS